MRDHPRVVLVVGVDHDHHVGPFGQAHHHLARHRQQVHAGGRGCHAAGVAHEVNNPLAYVKANVEALSKHLAQSEPLETDELWQLVRDTTGGIGAPAGAW